MTLRDAAREFAHLTSGFAIPKEHVELLQCVLNNTLERIYQTAMNVWATMPEEKRSALPRPVFDRLLVLLQFFADTADAARTGESPAMSLQKLQESLTADTENELNLVPLTHIDETTKP